MSSVLVVADDFRVRAFLDFILDEAGFAVKEAKDGSEAIDLFRRNSEAFDLVVLGDEQQQTLTALREANPDVQCCLLTSDFSAEMVSAHGIVAVFSKPIVDSAKFIREVRQLAGLTPPLLTDLGEPRRSLNRRTALLRNGS
jgi:CheY-like chemotaxis protein